MYLKSALNFNLGRLGLDGGLRLRPFAEAAFTILPTENSCWIVLKQLKVAFFRRLTFALF